MARDFFDELSDTITRTTKDLGKKAGQLYEAQKIKSKISSEEQMVINKRKTMSTETESRHWKCDL